MQKLISAIILTYNEEKHIGRCIGSLQGLVDEIFIVDSFSQDKTTEIAVTMGAHVYKRQWKNYATQFNWALENCPINSKWIWRIDADEYIEEESSYVRNQIESLPEQVTAVYVKRKIVFMGKELLHGGWFPVWHLKIWRHGKGFCENRWMDEHIKIFEGESSKIDCTQVDWNTNDLKWWTEKHVGYAWREMIDILDTQYGVSNDSSVSPNLFGNDEQRKRWLKMRYINLPLFLRPFLNFTYRYFIRLGFMDGVQGLIWHFLQGFWYRFLVDANIYELTKRFRNNKQEIIEYLKTNHK